MVHKTNVLATTVYCLNRAVAIKFFLKAWHNTYTGIYIYIAVREAAHQSWVQSSRGPTVYK